MGVGFRVTEQVAEGAEVGVWAKHRGGACLE